MNIGPLVTKDANNKFFKTIFLDMDGVLVDWNKSFCEWFDEDYDEWPQDAESPAEAFSMDKEEVRAMVARAGVRFWETLKPFPWANSLYESCTKLADSVYVLTSPMFPEEGACAMGKVESLREMFGPEFRDFVICRDKFLCSKKGTILVDDSPRKCEEFSSQEGESILFPAKGNGTEPVSDPYAYVMREFGTKVASKLEGTTDTVFIDGSMSDFCVGFLKACIDKQIDIRTSVSIG